MRKLPLVHSPMSSEQSRRGSAFPAVSLTRFRSRSGSTRFSPIPVGNGAYGDESVELQWHIRRVTERAVVSSCAGSTTHSPVIPLWNKTLGLALDSPRRAQRECSRISWHLIARQPSHQQRAGKKNSGSQPSLFSSSIERQYLLAPYSHQHCECIKPKAAHALVLWGQIYTGLQQADLEQRCRQNNMPG